MGKFSLENKIKERLEGHEVHVNKQELWKALGIEEEEKDRKFIWYWWGAGILGVLLIAGLWWSTTKHGLEESNKQEIQVIQVDDNVAKTGNEQLNDPTTSEQLAAIIEEVDAAGPGSSNASPVKSQTNVPSNSKSKLRTSGTYRKTLVAPIPAKDFSESEDATSGISNDDTTPTTKVPISRSLLEVDPGQLPYALNDLTFNRDLELPEYAVPPLIEPLKSVRRFEFEVFGGIGSITRTLKGPTDELTGFLLGRDTSEVGLEHISFGTSLKYNIAGGWYTKIGLAINQWNEKYEYAQETDTLETLVEVPESIVFNLDGTSTTILGEGVRTTYTFADWTRYNRLMQIDLPVTLGYEQRMGRWSAFGEATAIINLRQSFSGFIQTDQSIATENPEAFFKSRVGVNLGLNAGIGYGITPRLRARLSGRYYKSLNSVLIQSGENDQRYTSLGLRMSLGYLF
ncbi:MAG: hypothetical protein AAGA77_02670 [Bacteroidota bacterium]